MYDLKYFIQLSEQQQHQQMQEWLSSIATAEEEQRQQGIKELVLATSKLDDADKAELIKIRTIVLARMPIEQTKDIVRSRFKAMQDLRDIDDADRAMVIMMVRQMPRDVQQVVARVANELREEFSTMG
ncbi:hypothetical protein H8E77_17700 [bacterium]|nr:hypothetical protein [bacterium]